ncbi:MAG: hypothetical protein P8O97_03225 [Gammaproteobacteria bacterium]|nr:hypothetical protein [Gammaproteobacteria bacterium]
MQKEEIIKLRKLNNPVYPSFLEGDWKDGESGGIFISCCKGIVSIKIPVLSEELVHVAVHATTETAPGDDIVYYTFIGDINFHGKIEVSGYIKAVDKNTIQCDYQVGQFLGASGTYVKSES